MVIVGDEEMVLVRLSLSEHRPLRTYSLFRMSG
jgi:hypothetical protein